MEYAEAYLLHLRRHHAAIFHVKQCTEIGRKNLQRNISGPVTWKLAFITEDLNHD